MEVSNTGRRPGRLRRSLWFVRFRTLRGSPSKLLAEQLASEDIRVRLELFANLIRVFD